MGLTPSPVLWARKPRACREGEGWQETGPLATLAASSPQEGPAQNIKTHLFLSLLSWVHSEESPGHRREP